MSPRATIERAHALLDEAARARDRHRPERCLAALTEARDLLVDGPDAALLEKVAWRLAKAAYDFGTPEQMLDAVTPLLDAGIAFAHHGPGRSAMAPVAQRWWDSRGYADPRIARLWLAWAESYHAEGDPWMEAMGHAQRAWHLAVSGDHGGLDAIIERYLALDPRGFGSGPHRHPDAPDTPSSVWWAQLELLRTGLWACAWSGRRERARALVDALLDAAEGADLDREADPWFLDPLVRVGLAFDDPDLIDAWLAPWRRALQASPSDRAPFHLALGTGLAALRRGEIDAAWASLDRAVTLAAEGAIGAEWTVDALLARAAAEDRSAVHDAASSRAESRRLSTRFGLGVFSG